MKDDIETLRAFITGVYTDKFRREARPNALAALERVATKQGHYHDVLKELRGGLLHVESGTRLLHTKIYDAIAQLRSKDPNFTPIFDSYSASCERWHNEVEAARAKLERAKKALFFYRDEWIPSIIEHRSPTNALLDDAGFKASIAVSELSADAPAQQTQISDEGKPR